MLSRAVELVPEAVDLWLALARLETYDKVAFLHPIPDMTRNAILCAFLLLPAGENSAQQSKAGCSDRQRHLDNRCEAGRS